MRPAQTKALFILGSGRIGSTLIAQILGQTDGFWSVGELYRIWQDGLIQGDFCGCGVPVPECSFWLSVFADAVGGVEHARPEATAVVLYAHIRNRPRQLFALWRQVGRATASSPAGTYGELLRSMYVAVAKVSDSHVIVDSTKLPAHALVASGVADIDLYVVHLVRDPRAIAYSWSRNPDAGGRRGRSNLGFRGKGLLESTVQWTLFALFAETVLRRRLKGRYLLVRYEDFAARPRDITKQILEFVGEEQSVMQFVDDRNVALGDNHMVGGNRARFRRGVVPVKADEDWKESMPGRARLACTLIAWPLLLRYGYPAFRLSKHRRARVFSSGNRSRRRVRSGGSVHR